MFCCISFENAKWRVIAIIDMNILGHVEFVVVQPESFVDSSDS
jgi:hypothetical protein